MELKQYFQLQRRKIRIRKRIKKSKKSTDSRTSDALCFLDLKLFKVRQCTAGSNHNPKKCLNYHDSKRDRRRPIGGYSSEPCKNIGKGRECPFGDSCKRAHNRVEEFYHPEKYKVKFCSTYPHNTDSCEYGQFCSFVHQVEEMKIDLIDEMEKDEDFYMFHFKTVWCPYTEKKHARDEWVYAHNWQDFRRKPQLFPYSHEQWSQWQSRTFIQVYGDGCKNEFLCPFSHGWKEQEYHPKNYKMNAWRNDSSCNKAHCPYFHSDNQKRCQVPEGFKIQPRNRGTVFQSNEYLAEFIQNQAQLILPHRSKIYHPSTAPFVNSDVFMKQPYYIVHAALGFKDQNQFSYYLNGHAEDQQEHKQKSVSGSNKGKISRTFSHNTQMNIVSSVPFYPGKGNIISKPIMSHINSYKDINNRFPTSTSHGVLTGMSNWAPESQQNVYWGPPGMENSIPSQNNLYRPPIEERNGAWNRQIPPYPNGNFSNQNNQNYMQWQNSTSQMSQMIPSALQAQHQEGIPLKKGSTNMKGSMSTEFNYNFTSKLLNDNEEKASYGLFENNSDSDDANHIKGPPFHSKIGPIHKYSVASLRNFNNYEDGTE